MFCFFVPAIVPAIVAALGACAAHAQQYHVTLLYPEDGQGSGMDAYYFAKASAAGHSSQYARNPGTGTTMSRYWDVAQQANVEVQPLDANTSAIANGIWNRSLVGVGRGPATDDMSHAMLWADALELPIDLHPPGYLRSEAYEIYDTVQVGYATTPGSGHAMLWRGTPESAVDLHPTGYHSSRARGVSENAQVGDAILPAAPFICAMVWYGSAESAVDLHPAGFRRSEALAAHGNTQVGATYQGVRDPQAMLWRRSAESAVNLHPEGYEISAALGAYGDTQVGYGGDRVDVLPRFGRERALLWKGTAGSVVDLHSMLGDLPFEFSDSRAQRIYPNGEVVGIGVGVDRRTYALRWTPVPEPASVTLLALSLLAVVGVRRSCAAKR